MQTSATRKRGHIWGTLRQLTGLWILACAWPLFDQLRRYPEFFVLRGNTAGDVLLLAFGWALAPPLILAGIISIAGAGSRSLGRWLEAGIVGILTGIMIMAPVGEATFGSTQLAIVTASVAAATVGWAYLRTSYVRSFTAILSLAPLVVLPLFLIFSPARRLLIPHRSSPLTAAVRASGTPIVWITFDEFPAISLMDRTGNIDHSRVPNFSRFAEEATWYRNATTVADATEMALPALLTGRRPSSEELPNWQDHPRNLFTLLGGLYRLNVVEPLTDLCPDELCGSERRQSSIKRWRSLVDDLAIVEAWLLLPRGLHNRLPPVDRSWQGFGEDQSRESKSTAKARLMSRLAGADPVALVERFINGVSASSSRPQLDFLHVPLPHSPWHYLPSGRRYPIPGIPGLSQWTWTDNVTLVNQAWQRHLLQTGFADKLLGKILNRLREVGIYDRALIVVMADHGVSFRPNTLRRGVAKGNFPDIANVPLFVKLPGQREGRVDDAPVSTIDVLPTVVRAAGIDVPPSWQFDGIAFSDVADRESITVGTNYGTTVTVAFSNLRRERNRRLLDQWTLLQDGRDIFGFGASAPELLGRLTRDLAVQAIGSAGAQIENPLVFIDPAQPVMPIYLRGQVANLPTGSPVALAINGRVAVTTRTYGDADRVVFSALLPPHALRPGSNVIDAYQILSSTSLRRLTREATRTLSDTYTLDRSGGNERLLGPTGPLNVGKDAVTGFLDHAIEDHGTLSLRGWAAPQDLTASAERVAVFVGDHLIALARPSLERVDLIKVFRGKEKLRHAGFAVTIPVSVLQCDEPTGGLRTFGIVGNVAGKLKVVGNIQETVATACLAGASHSPTKQ